ncbi:MAG: efflux RND transporter permease subunit [Kiritimatiellia bacterium]
MLISNYSIKFRIAVLVFIAVFIITGITSYLTIPREGSPDITIPYVFVNAIYDGTAPEDLEKLVTVPLERQLQDLENVKEMRSVTSDSVSFIAIEFLAGQDIDNALQRTKDKVDLASPDLPPDLNAPVVQAINISSDIPILTLALSGDTSLDRLKHLAEDLKEEIELVNGVRTAEVSGAREREVRVEMEPQRLAAYGIPLAAILQTIAAENRTISAGNLEIGSDRVQVRVPGEFVMAADIATLVIAGTPEQPVFLRDVADVYDTFKDIETISRIDGNPSISIGVKKRAGENSVRLINNVREAIERVPMPPGITLTTVMDESDYVDMIIKELENNVATGFILVVIVLMIFMGFRNAFFVAVAIPFSMMIAFTLMSAAGTSMNMIVLFSLVLSVGMLVDNAIVMVENIYRHRTEGKSRIDAAREGAAEVAWPVITSTLTTCAAFSPLLFWPGIMGQFMGFLPRTLIITLFASLFVAIVVNPAVCSFLIGGRKRLEHERHKTHPFTQAYESFLRGALHHRIPVLLLGFLFLAISIQIYGRYGKGVELFPDTSPRNAIIEVRFPQGTAIEHTDSVLQGIESQLHTFADIKFFLATAGQGAGGGFLGGGAGGHIGNIQVEFVDFQDRQGDSRALVATLRELAGRYPGAEIKVDRQQEGPPTGAPVSIEVSGEDFDVLYDLAQTIIDTIVTIPGLVDLQHDYESALPELQFQIDRVRAAKAGFDTSSLGNYLRMALYGLEASKLRAEEEEFEITLRFPPQDRQSLDTLASMLIPPPQGGQAVPLSALGTFRYVGGRGAISRKDQRRVITINGDAAGGRGVDVILEDVQRRMQNVAIPSGYSVTYTGEDQEMRESGAFLSRAFGLALGLILVILVLQFNSVLMPLIIVFSILLSLIGVMWGLLICGMRFGVIMTGVGVISLAGIVVNNSIVLIDCIQQRRTAGIEVFTAIITAGKLRLRPVLLTATTTILGLVPMAVGYSLDFQSWPPKLIAGAESSQWWAPMAVAVIFGLAVATILTLILVPVMYSVVHTLVQAITRSLPTRDP